MEHNDEEQYSKPPGKNIEDLELMREAKKNEAEAWKKLLENLERLTSDKKANNEKDA